MLDSLAYEIYALGRTATAIITFGLLGLGGLVRACLHPPVAPLSRSRFFLLLNFVGVLAALALLPPLLLPWAISSGMLAGLLLLQWLLAVAIGAVLFPIAAGRALDAFDTPYLAALAYVPFGSIVLLAKGRARSRRGIAASAPQHTSATLNTVVGLFLALLVLVVAVKAFRAYEGMDQALAANPDLRGLIAGGFIGSPRLERTLELMAWNRQQGLPHRLNETLVVTDVVADGRRLVMTIAIDPPDLRLARLIEFGLPHGQVRDIMVTQFCEEFDSRPLVDAGATLEFVFTTEPDGELGRLEITSADCAEAPTPDEEMPDGETQTPAWEADGPGEEI
ncbi:MAG: hypothetical protein KDA49_02530 [Rhodospirillaceae bacterium]|nr:hypothetical protein [Rhodospirillaceae bacterium]